MLKEIEQLMRTAKQAELDIVRVAKELRESSPEKFVFEDGFVGIITYDEESKSLVHDVKIYQTKAVAIIEVAQKIFNGYEDSEIVECTKACAEIIIDEYLNDNYLELDHIELTGEMLFADVQDLFEDLKKEQEEQLRAQEDLVSECRGRLM